MDYKKLISEIYTQIKTQQYNDTYSKKTKQKYVNNAIQHLGTQYNKQ